MEKCHNYLSVLVAKDASNFRISKGFPDPPKGDLAYDTKENIWQTGDAILPKGEWDILGLSDYLNSEQHSQINGKILILKRK